MPGIAMIPELGIVFYCAQLRLLKPQHILFLNKIGLRYRCGLDHLSFGDRNRNLKLSLTFLYSDHSSLSSLETVSLRRHGVTE